jgi:hypothetical protein
MSSVTWKVIFGFVLGIVILLAWLLVATKSTIDLYVRDRYFVVTHGQILLVLLFLLIAALGVWRWKISH